MDPFIDFPNEMIVEICNRSKTPDLLRLSETSSKLYQVCYREIKKRKEQFYKLIQQKYGKVLDYLNSLPLDITKINISKKKLDTLKYLNLERFINLKKLNCSLNHLITLEGLENLGNLQILSCHNNELITLKNIKNPPMWLKNLQKLHCYTNNLTTLEGLENCINLIELNCSNNNLTTLEGLPLKCNLIELNCSYNKLTSLEGLENCTNLQILKYEDEEIEI